MNPMLARFVAVVVGRIVFRAAEHVIYNHVKETVSEPKIGGIVYCDLLLEASHSGVYVGNGEIVHLDGSGIYLRTSAKEFINRLKGLNPAFTVYTFCRGDAPVGLASAAAYAEKMVGRKTKYSVLKNNCHRFTASCLLGYTSKENPWTVNSVKRILDKIIGASTSALVWNWR